MFKTLYEIGKKLNDHNINWAIGGSLLLNHFNLRDFVNDIDIIVSIDDNPIANEVVKKMATAEKNRISKIFVSDCFNEYIIDGISVDVISNFKIKNESGIYEYDFSKDAIGKIVTINKTAIPLTRLSDWYVIYNLIPNSEEKLSALEKYFQKNYPNKKRLIKALESNLPKAVEEKIKRYL